MSVFFCRADALLLQLLDLLFLEFFNSDKTVIGGIDGTQKLIELDLNGEAVAVLGILYEKHHKKRYDRGPGIDDQLPCVRKMKDGAGNSPENNGQQGEDKRCRHPACAGDPSGNMGERCVQRISGMRIFINVEFWHSVDIKRAAPLNVPPVQTAAALFMLSRSVRKYFPAKGFHQKATLF